MAELPPKFAVTYEGREIPRLQCVKRRDGAISLTVDSRFGGDFPTEESASQAAFLIANAMAIGAGLPSANTDKFAPRGKHYGKECVNLFARDIPWQDASPTPD